VKKACLSSHLKATLVALQLLDVAREFESIINYFDVLGKVRFVMNYLDLH